MSRLSNGLSVIIVTYNAEPQLALCLRYLRRQLTVEDEVIVINDGGRVEAAQTVAAEQGGACTSWRYFYYSPKSSQFRLAASRNLGLRWARCSRVLCLDGDCLAAAGMLNYHRASNPWVFLCGLRRNVETPVEVLSREEPHDNHVGAEDERYKLKGGIYQPSYDLLKHKKYGAIHYRACWGFQQSFTLQHAMSIGGFNEEFTSYGGEDQEFAGRMQQSGALLDLQPVALCYHLAHPKRDGDWKRQVADSLTRQSPVRNGGPLVSFNQ